MNSEHKRMGLAVMAAALGYFVDAYDLILYNIVRVQSLRGIGVPEAELLGTGVDLLNAQLLGMLLGGVLWGAGGLILAIPLTAAIKAVCDNVSSLQPYGRLLGD